MQGNGSSNALADCSWMTPVPFRVRFLDAAPQAAADSRALTEGATSKQFRMESPRGKRRRAGRALSVRGGPARRRVGLAVIRFCSDKPGATRYNFGRFGGRPGGLGRRHAVVTEDVRTC